MTSLSPEGDGDMHGTTEAFVSKHSYLSSSFWNLYTQPLKDYNIEPYDDVYMQPFEVPNVYKAIETVKVLF